MVIIPYFIENSLPLMITTVNNIPLVLPLFELDIYGIILYIILLWLLSLNNVFAGFNFVDVCVYLWLVPFHWEIIVHFINLSLSFSQLLLKNIWIVSIFKFVLWTVLLLTFLKCHLMHTCKFFVIFLKLIYSYIQIFNFPRLYQTIFKVLGPVYTPPEIYEKPCCSTPLPSSRLSKS